MISIFIITLFIMGLLFTFLSIGLVKSLNSNPLFDIETDGAMRKTAKELAGIALACYLVMWVLILLG